MLLGYSLRLGPGLKRQNIGFHEFKANGELTSRFPKGTFEYHLAHLSTF